MSKYAKAFGAAAGGGAAGLGGAVALLPDGSPWYAYVLVIAIAAFVPMLSTYVSPRNSAAAVLLLVATLALSACGGVSDRITETTGTTLEQRCANYRLTLAQWTAYREAGGKMTEDRVAIIGALQAAIGANCGPPVVGVAPPAK